MSPRTGRPKAENPKLISIKARIDEETNERLKEHCERTGKTKTDIVREGIELVLAKK